MPDTGSHQRVHPDDARDLAGALESRLRRACEELSFLVSRGYAEGAALVLVAERHELTPPQRDAVMRAACSDHALRQIELWLLALRAR
jgi:hypothetical protein